MNYISISRPGRWEASAGKGGEAEIFLGRESGDGGCYVGRGKGEGGRGVF